MNKVLSGYKITAFECDDSVMVLSTDIIEELNLDIKKTLLIKFGNLSIPCSIVQMPSKNIHSNGIIRISKLIYKTLSLPETIPLSIKYTGNHEFRFGPVIGILTLRNLVDTERFSHYLNYVRYLGNGLLYVFSIRGLDPKTKTINGYYFNQSTKKWEQGNFPYPDAVIDLCYPNAYKAHQVLKSVIGGGKIFNRKTLINKLDFCNALKEHPFLVRHLPETRVLTNNTDLESFLTRYPEIFLKPVNGMQGKGIIKLSLQNGILECQYRFKNENITKKLVDTSEVFSILHDLTSTRTPYIMQNAIPRMEYKGSPFCFRTMVCKNGNGQWIAPAIFPKTASDKGFLTNHASGARFVPLKTLFIGIKRKLPCTKSELIDQLIDLSVKTAQALDQKFGPLGKIGIDTVIDQSGKPWLIEANGNPGPVPYSHMVEFPSWMYQAYQLPLFYARYLAGFSH